MKLFETDSITINNVAVACVLSVFACCVAAPIIAFVLSGDLLIFLEMAVCSVFGAVLGTHFTYTLVKKRLRNLVRMEVGADESVPGTEFMEKTLRYLGHEVETLGGNAIVADKTVLVYVNSYINGGDINEMLRLATEKQIETQYAIERRFGSGVTDDAWALIHRHGMGLANLDRVFDAVYRQIRKGGPRKPERKSAVNNAPRNAK